VGVFRGKTTHLKACLFNFLRKLDLPSNPDEVKAGGVNRVLHRERVLRLGDAASLAEPLTGEVIYYAIKSAELAARIIYHSLQDNSLGLSRYTQQINLTLK
jgi:flavin-dependent dehydrogenase